VILSPLNSSLTPQNPSESIILQDRGNLQNVFVKSATAKKLILTLYNSHLKIEDAETGEVMEDVLLNQIVKTSHIFQVLS